MHKIFLGVLVTLSLFGCSSRPNSNALMIESRPEVRASARISDSFTVDELKSELLKTDKAHVTIARSALEKEFLLQASLIPQQVAATSSNLKSRIVSFRERNGKLYLLEATQGHVVTTQLPSSLILAEFPILRANDNEITSDFNTGMSNLFVYGDWNAKDFSGPSYDALGNFQSAKLRYSYLESASTTAQNQLVIRQVAQLVFPSNGAEINTPVEVKYYLAPYRPDPTYETFLSPASFDDFGYFEVAPQLTATGASKVYASRFHPKKTITFAISANTPTEYRKAVEDGILYWNKVFGTEVVKVGVAPEGVTAPDMNHNIVQWVNWDFAGFAYADAQMDPRSGEILHAQVFMTSAFAFHGRIGALQLLRRLRAGTNAHPAQFSLRGFEKERMCDRHMNQLFADSLGNVLASNATDEVIAKMVGDYVREVIAHEIGHTLGLRHNFAGSLAANYSLNHRDQNFKSYLATKSAPEGLITSSSVMEYQRFEEGVFTGDQISKGASLSYDKAAIQNLYQGKKIQRGELPLFCTDTHLYSDCQVFDVGSSPVEYWLWSTQDAIDHHANLILEEMIYAKVPVSGEEPIPIEKVALPNPPDIAGFMMKDRETLLQLFTDKAKLLKIHRRFEAVGGHNEDEVRAEHQRYLANEIERLGGLQKIFGPTLGDFAEKSSERINTLFKEGYASGFSSPDKKFEFTAQEIDIIQKHAAKYFDKLEAELQEQDISLMGGAKLAGSKFVEGKLSADLVPLFESRMRDYIFSTTGEFLMADIEIPIVQQPIPGTPATPAVLPAPVPIRMASVKLPIFKYPLAIRTAAGSLLRDDRGENTEWGFIERMTFQEEFKKTLDTALTAPIETVVPHKMPRSVARWILENRLVLASVGAQLVPTPAK